MTDNVPFQTTPATPASGTIVAADEVTYSGDTTQVQIVQLAAVGGTEGSRTIDKIGGDAANGLDVDVTRVGGTVTVANGGTFAVQESGAALTALQLLDNIVTTEDTASSNGDSGIVAFARRSASPADTSGTDGDYEALQVNAGRLWASATIDAAIPAGTNNIGDVDVLTLPALPAGNNNIGDVDIASIAAGDNNIGNVDIVTMPNVTLAAGTNTNEVVGDVAHDAAIAGNPLVVGGVASATAPADVSADQDAVRSWHLRNGAQATVLTAAGALIGGDAANGLDVDVTRVQGTVTVSGTVTANAGTGTLTTSDTATQVDDAAFTPTTGRVMMIGATLDDTSPDTVNEGDGGAVRMSADRALHVSLRDSAGNNRGLNVDANNRIGAVVQGSVAHDSAAADNPLIMGGVAESTRPAAVADGDAVRSWFDTAGRQVVAVGSPQTVYAAAEYTSSQTDTSLIAAPGANLQIVIFDITVSTGTAGTVLLEDGTTTRLFGRLSLAANGGWQFNSPVGVRLTANQALTITTTTAAGPLAITVNYAILPSL